MPDLVLVSENLCQLEGKVYSCASGKGGIVLDKNEGDGGTPVGIFPLRQIFYRADRVMRPTITLPVIALQPTMGWCDDPDDGAYNQPVTLPYAARHEELWRNDQVYDLILVVGYNDDPIIPRKGSAIFIHLAREDYSPTQGCLAFSLEDLQEILQKLTPASCVVIPSL